MTYREIIDAQMSELPESMSWWPNYFYHFTNIENAIGIISRDWIYSRQDAVVLDVMKTDNASQSVMSETSGLIKKYARLYFRPLTPTQYNNEGYKPVHTRRYRDANCAFPVFFVLDAESILNQKDTQFSPVSCAGKQILNLFSGEDSYAKLPFKKIYNVGPIQNIDREDIVRHRQAEVLNEFGFSLHNSLKSIVCRSIAEKQTLLYLLNKFHPNKFEQYRSLIKFSPEQNLFFNNGVFIKNIVYFDGKITVVLNEIRKRIKKQESIGNDFIVETTLEYIDELGNYVGYEHFIKSFNYANTQYGFYNLSKPDNAIYVIVEIRFDNNLMYNNLLNLSDEIVI